ncbi:MAG: cytidylate kinase-like family protein [Chloroflexi bacterium]|nr:cytidylate kinase-like family protein [Chloroflexota bacterium]
MAVIAMGGLSGGGGRKLGPLVAQRIDADYVDRFILTDVARHAGATVEALHEREERPPTRGERFSRILQRILERSAVTGAGGDPYFGPGVAAYLTQEFEDLPQPTITRGHELEDEKYFEAVSKTMHDLAAVGNVVIVGRGGYIILRDVPGVLRVGVVATLEDRIQTIVERERIDREEAERTVQARDKARVNFFKRFFGIEHPDSPELYDLVVNTSDMDLDYSVDIVVGASAALEEGRLRPKVTAPV